MSESVAQFLVSLPLPKASVQEIMKEKSDCTLKNIQRFL